MPKNFQLVEQNIYRGGAPSMRDLQILNSTYKIKRVISLDAGVASSISPTLKQMKIEHIVIPVNPGATTITDPLNNLIRNISTLLTAKQPVYIHCLQGQDRTGLAIALFRVQHDHWTCEQALNEARRFNFGAGISQAVQNLYKQILSGLTGKVDLSQVNDGDIVSNMREDENYGNKPLAFNPQQSFAPEIDLKYLGQNSNQNYMSSNQSNERKRKLRLQVLQNIDDGTKIPSVGEYGNSGPIQGAGPVENSGILQLI